MIKTNVNFQSKVHERPPKSTILSCSGGARSFVHRSAIRRKHFCLRCRHIAKQCAKFAGVSSTNVVMLLPRIHAVQAAKTTIISIKSKLRQTSDRTTSGQEHIPHRRVSRKLKKTAAAREGGTVERQVIVVRNATRRVLGCGCETEEDTHRTARNTSPKAATDSETEVVGKLKRTTALSVAVSRGYCKQV